MPPASTAAAKITLIGFPDSGKRLIFNNLSGKAVSAGKKGNIIKSDSGLTEQPAETVDTPGLHGLYIQPGDELNVRDWIFDEQPDAVIQCLDIRKLRQSIELTADLMELDVPIIPCLDHNNKYYYEGRQININKLSEHLGLNVIVVNAFTKAGAKKLKTVLANPQPKGNRPQYGRQIESSIAALVETLPKEFSNKRKTAILALENDVQFIDRLIEKHGVETLKDFTAKLNSIQKSAEIDMVGLISETRRRWADAIIENITEPEPKISSFGVKFGSLCRRPVSGLLILLFFIVIMFFMVTDVATILAGFLENDLWMPVEQYLNALLPSGLMRDFMIGEYGILTFGLANALITILPILSLFYLFFSTLENAGYLPHLTSLSSKVVGKAGLSGKAVAPLILAFSCRTISILSMRTLGSKREKIIAVFIATIGIPCGAQMGLSMNVLNRFGSKALFLTFAIIVLVDVMVGLILNRFIKKDSNIDAFAPALPPMRLPSPSTVLKQTFLRTYGFVKEATPIFIIVAIALFIANEAGILNDLRVVLRPVVVNLMGLPEQMEEVILICMARPELAAAMIMDIIDKGLMTIYQGITAVVLTIMIPCAASVGALVKLMGTKNSLIMFISVYLFAFIIAVALNNVFSLIVG